MPKVDSGTKTKYRGAMKSGIGTVADRRSPLAPFPWAQVTPAQTGFTVAPPGMVGAPVRKGHAKGGEPAGGKNAHRVQRFERHGAQHRVIMPMMGGQPTVTAAGVKYPPAAATQANGRIIPSYPKAQDRWSGGDFWEMAGSKW